MVKIGKHNLEKPEKEAECLDKIEEASGFLLDLVNDVLDMNKLESGEIVLEEEPFDFKKILQDSVTVVETQAAAAGVTFHRERAGGTISFTSEEGVGTTFTIEFRFLLAPETEKGDNSKDNTMQDFQGTQQIRAMHRPDAATIPIIAMTANAFADDIQQSKEAGMSEHLSKPLDEQKMFAMIRKYCREKKEGENQ